MRTIKSETSRKEEFVAEAEAMYVPLRRWRAEHAEASFDEIGDQVTAERQRLMAKLLGELAAQPEEEWMGAEVCSSCGRELTPKGKRRREVGHLEGEVQVEREYHYCDECQSGFFPPGRQTEADETCVESAYD